jgi:hypothetical protein
MKIMAQTAQHHQCAYAQPSTTIRFCPHVAAAIGVSEAIVIHRLDYWLGRTKHHFDGQPWIYNTYESWQEQFPFWSHRTIQATFRRLECLGIVESSQAYNRSRWDKTKWYTLNYAKLGDLVPQTPTTQAPADDVPMTAPSMTPEAPIDDTQTDTIDDAKTAPSWITKDSSTKDATKILNRACVREPDAGARTHALETPEPVVSPCHREEKPVNELDVAYEAIPEAERHTWYERADRALEAAGLPQWMRITPTVKEMALRLWVGTTIPGVQTG